MHNIKKVKHLAAICEILTDRTDEVVELMDRAGAMLSRGTDLTDKVGNRQLGEVESLLRLLSQRCGRLADEVATMKDRNGNN